ncbi:MAG: hypothetical protein OXP70_06035 [Acidobacteriota bacterium]|nr:hypothetical protein [Acidobacteriota bacterium]
MARFVALGVVMVAGLLPGRLPAYDFYPPGVTSSAGAVRWKATAFPLRFRILDTGAFPDYAGLNAETWREIVLRGVSAWVEVETADISIVVEHGTLVGVGADIDDGIHTIGFEAREEWLDNRASALVVWRGRDLTECDVLLDPAIFDGWPENDPDVAEWAAFFLEELVMHEMGHCLGLRHVPANPVWLGQDANMPDWPSGFLPEPLAGLSSDPQMSIAASYGVPRLTPDDRIGVSLLYPAPGFVEERGSIGGRLLTPEGEPAAFLYVQSVDHASGTAVFGPGVFADELGQFLLEGLPAGPVHLWVRPTRLYMERPGYQNARSWDLLDEHRWLSVRPGVAAVLPDITLRAGRGPPP